MDYQQLRRNKVMLFGGHGFIGKNVQLQLDFLNIDYRVFDRELRPNNDMLVRRHIINQIEEYEPTVIVNLAARNILDSLESPHEVYVENILMINNLLYAIQPFNIHLLHISSIEAYGDAAGKAHTSYSLSKRHVDSMVRKCNNDKYFIMRLSNQYGPFQKEYDNGSVVPKMMNSLLNNKPITVYGDGEQTRRFSYVKDTAFNILNFINLNYPQREVDIFGDELSINNLVGLLLKISNRNPIIKYVGNRPADMRTTPRPILKPNYFPVRYSPAKFGLENAFQDYISVNKTILR